MSRHFGWWCSWCSTWVDAKDTRQNGDVRIHQECGYVVDKRSSDRPIVPAPPFSEVKAAHKAHARMMDDFMRAAQ